ncbi:hypothetical protein BRADI_1g57778v3 [Brachypodium distachyon]|uniref:Reverse transcriptase zinc-binding domain-containing protein n=1 Tax=Brachypodium distachyon TaxID=15368 RepID=A0A2K2DS44_BRADI|nr:hypothetical protein BRADI_1g57778v3 [Brachypodium distachyon]
MGGLGVSNSRMLNLALMAKWVWKIFCEVRFWQDRWLGADSLRVQFPKLFSIARDVEVSIKDAWDDRALLFRRSLGPLDIPQWEKLEAALSGLSLSHDPDQIRWRLESSEEFSTSSLYNLLMAGPSVCFLEYIWGMKVPLKIKLASPA